MTKSAGPLWIIRGLAIFFICLAPGGQATADIIYGITGVGMGASSLYTVDPSTGSATVVAPVKLGGNNVALSAIAYDPVNGMLYAGTNATSSSVLVTINMQTAVATQVGTGFGLNNSMTALSFASDGTLFGYAKTSPNEALYTVSTSTGQASLVGNSGLSGTSGDGFAVTHDKATSYFATGGASGGTLYHLSTSNGAATMPGLALTPGTGVNVNGQIKGLTFNTPGSILYGIDVATTSPNAAQLVEIDQTSGDIALVGATQNGLVGLASVPAVPEPGGLTLVGLPAAGYFIWTAVFRRRAVKRK